VCTNSQFQSQDGRNNLLYLPTDFLLIIYTHSPSSLIFSRAHERQYYWVICDLSVCLLVIILLMNLLKVKACTDNFTCSILLVFSLINITYYQ
jgi:hypothetical protein